MPSKDLAPIYHDANREALAASIETIKAKLRELIGEDADWSNHRVQGFKRGCQEALDLFAGEGL